MLTDAGAPSPVEARDDDRCIEARRSIGRRRLHPEEQAKTAASALAEVMTDTLVTKAYLAVAKPDLEHAIERLRSVVDVKIERLRSELEHMRSGLDALELRLTVKLGAMLVVAVGAMGILFKFGH